MALPFRLGIFGGTFDPPHRGHLAVARAARDQLDLDEVRLMVAGDPWQKRDRSLAPRLLRLELTELLIGNEPRLRTDNREVLRTGPTYTIDTVEALLGEATEMISITLIMGIDAAAGIETWHRARDLAKHVTLAVAPRPGCDPLELSDWWSVVPLVGLDSPCASTDLRASGHNEDFLRQCLPEPILLRLAQEGLYAERDGN
jgi:nicotinate-nucleotide adenylyltransferase